jgi:hypothetical protein
MVNCEVFTARLQLLQVAVRRTRNEELQTSSSCYTRKRHLHGGVRIRTDGVRGSRLGGKRKLVNGMASSGMTTLRRVFSRHELTHSVRLWEKARKSRKRLPNEMLLFD